MTFVFLPIKKLSRGVLTVAPTPWVWIKPPRVGLGDFFSQGGIARRYVAKRYFEAAIWRSVS